MIKSFQIIIIKTKAIITINKEAIAKPDVIAATNDVYYLLLIDHKPTLPPIRPLFYKGLNEKILSPRILFDS